MSSWSVQETNDGVQFKVKVQPRSSKNELCGLQGDALKVKLTAPPVDGEANAACLKYLAQCLGVSPSRLRLVSGSTNPQKIFRAEGLNKEQLIQCLQRDI